MTILSTITQEISLETITEDFGPTLDKYGFERGYRMRVIERVYAPKTADGSAWGVSPGTWFDLVLQPLRRRAGGEWENYQAYTSVQGKCATQIAARNYGYATMIKARGRLEKLAAARR